MRIKWQSTRIETESLEDAEGLGIRLNKAWRKALGFWRVLGLCAQELFRVRSMGP